MKECINVHNESILKSPSVSFPFIICLISYPFSNDTLLCTIIPFKQSKVVLPPDEIPNQEKPNSNNESEPTDNDTTSQNQDNTNVDTSGEEFALLNSTQLSIQEAIAEKIFL